MALDRSDIAQVQAIRRHLTDAAPSLPVLFAGDIDAAGAT
jgi:hypothetical protein